MTREEAKKTIREVFSNYFTFDGEAEADKVIGVLEQDKTNGDMIREMFPHYDIEIDEYKGYVHIFYDDFYTTYPLRWWLTPYKRGDGE